MTTQTPDTLAALERMVELFDHTGLYGLIASDDARANGWTKAQLDERIAASRDAKAAIKAAKAAPLERLAGRFLEICEEEAESWGGGGDETADNIAATWRDRADEARQAIADARTSPALRDSLQDGLAAACGVVRSWSRGDLAGAVNALSEWVETSARPALDEDEAEQWDGPTDSDGAPCTLINHYTCPDCGEDWSDQWSSACDDDCPACGLTCSPERSEDAEDDDAPLIACERCGDEHGVEDYDGEALCTDCQHAAQDGSLYQVEG